MNRLYIGSVLRHVVSGVGSVYAMHGYTNGIVFNVMLGGILVVVAIVASIHNKKRMVGIR